MPSSPDHGVLGSTWRRPMEVDRDHRPPGTPGQVGGPPVEGLGPAVGRAPALGEDDEIPAVLDDLGCRVRRPPAHLAALNWDGRKREGPQHGLPGAVEEVVGGGGDDRPVAELDRQRREQQGCVDVAGVVGGEDHGPLDVLQVLQPAHRRRRQQACRRPREVVHHHRASQTGPGSAVTTRGRSPARPSARGRAVRASSATWAGREESGPNAPARESPRSPSAHV